MRYEAEADRDGREAEGTARRDAARWWREQAARGPAPGPSPDEARRQALADVGHELKSPLSILLALCGRMQDSGELAGQNAEDLARIRANAFTMLRRVQDMMLMARLETFDPHLEPAVIDVAAIVRACVDGFGSLAAERRLDLRSELPGHLPALADEEKLVSVVSNLVANAIRHAPEGGIVRCSLRTTAERILLEVADDGPGVPAGERDQIFERYRRGTQSGGTGLGLAIVREIAHLHGGSAAVGDAPEGGALFIVDLPLRMVQGAPSGGLSALRLADRQQAIVEDLRSELGVGRRRPEPTPRNGTLRPLPQVR